MFGGGRFNFRNWKRKTPQLSPPALGSRPSARSARLGDGVLQRLQRGSAALGGDGAHGGALRADRVEAPGGAVECGVWSGPKGWGGVGGDVRWGGGGGFGGFGGREGGEGLLGVSRGLFVGGRRLGGRAGEVVVGTDVWVGWGTGGVGGGLLRLPKEIEGRRSSLGWEISLRNPRNSFREHTKEPTTASQLPIPVLTPLRDSTNYGC